MRLPGPLAFMTTLKKVFNLAYLKGICAKIARFGIHKKIGLKAVSI